MERIPNSQNKANLSQQTGKGDQSGKNEQWTGTRQTSKGRLTFGHKENLVSNIGFIKVQIPKNTGTTDQLGLSHLLFYVS